MRETFAVPEGDTFTLVHDVLINLIEVSPENWSFGNGLMSYGPPEP